MLRRVIALQIGVLGPHVLTGGGLVQASFSRQAAWRLGEQLLWGQKWLHWVWGPCLVVGAQGDTLKAWVVKLLGGLSASARAQRTLDSLFLWRVLTLQWGSQVQSEEKVVGAQVAWVVKLLGGLSASACAQRTLESPHFLKDLAQLEDGMFFAVSLGVHRLRLWDFAHRHCSVVKLLGGRVHLLTNCVKDAVCISHVRAGGLAGSACTRLMHAQRIRCRWQGSAVLEKKEPSSVPWCSWAIHSWIFFEPIAPGVQLLSTVFRVVFCLMLRNIVANGTDVTLRRCPRVWAPGERPPPPTWSRGPVWMTTWSATSTLWGTWTCSCPGTSHRSVKFDLLTAVFGKYSSSQDDDYGYDSHLSNRASAARGQRRSHHFLRHREELDGEVVFDCA